MDYSKMPLLDFIDKIWEGSDITNIEIYNYFEKITGNFDKEKIKISLNDIDCYYTLTLIDDILNESIDIYTKNGWEIPYIDMTNLLDEILLSNNKKANNKKILVHDSKTMLNKTHFAKGYSLHYAMNLLKRKLNEYEQPTPPTIAENKPNEQPTPPTSTNDVENEYPQYFSDYCYSLLLYLNERYETTKLQTKYSNIFHFLKYCEIMECTQLEYIDFVKMKYNIPLSKILNKSLRYLETIQPKLLRFKSAFDKN